jgi:hypothetical protein
MLEAEVGRMGLACGDGRNWDAAPSGRVRVADEGAIAAGSSESGSDDAQGPGRQQRRAERRTGAAVAIDRRGQGHDVSHWKLPAGMVPMRRIRPPQSGQTAKESRRASVLGSPSAVGATSSSLGSWRFRRSSKSRTQPRLKPRSPLARNP